MNIFLNTNPTHRCLCFAFFLAIALIGATVDPPVTYAASTLYWCPDRKADQQYSAKPGPGCSPLAEPKAPTADSDDRPLAPEREPKDFKIDNLQRDVSEFLTRYRQFLDCCKTDLGELRQVEELGNEVGDLLLSVQAQISNHSLASRGVMLREMIPPVAKARADLRALRTKLEQIGDSMRQRENADLEQAGRQAQTIRALQDSIDRDITAPNLPGGPKTGAAIGSAPATGPNIGKTPTTGSSIGSEAKTGQDIGASPRSGGDLGGSGPSGFAIGNTGRAGPSIGESDLNSENSSNVGSSLQRSTVGSSLSDSSIGSSMGSSSIGSSLQDTSVGSSFGGSSVGSSLQNRGTGR